MLTYLIFLGCLSYSITKLVIAVKQRKNGENVSLVGPILAIVISAILLIMYVFFGILEYQMMRCTITMVALIITISVTDTAELL